MASHFLGQDGNSGGVSSARGSSLAVRQFCAVAFGRMPVHLPSSPFRVEVVEAEERYCLWCYGVRMFDVVRGTPRLAPPTHTGTSQMGDRNLERGMVEAALCRCCGHWMEAV